MTCSFPYNKAHWMMPSMGTAYKLCIDVIILQTPQTNTKPNASRRTVWGGGLYRSLWRGYRARTPEDNHELSYRSIMLEWEFVHFCHHRHSLLLKSIATKPSRVRPSSLPNHYVEEGRGRGWGNTRGIRETPNKKREWERCRTRHVGSITLCTKPAIRYTKASFKH